MAKTLRKSLLWSKILAQDNIKFERKRLNGAVFFVCDPRTFYGGAEYALVETMSLTGALAFCVRFLPYKRWVGRAAPPLG